ncbi:MAG TPA: hypothetical protein VL633_12755 [Bacteroidota bacterium]|nr:hypothetical protein [Bacteroidota bacterium]
MLKLLIPSLVVLGILSTMGTHAQQRSTTLVQSILDESILISTDKPVYFPEDTLHLSIRREDSTTTESVTPIVAIEGMKLTPAGHNTYSAVIPQTVTPGSYRILLRIIDARGRRFIYETGRAVEVEEYQAVEQLSNYASILPSDGSGDPRTAVPLDAEQIRTLQVVFRRDSIRSRMGPQFVTIRTTVQLRDGTTAQTIERRVLTFRSHGDPERDRAVFIQYRTAYGAYAAISTEELLRVRLTLDSLPPWSTIKVNIEPDYTIRIGGFDRSNSITRYFRVRGPTIEIGFSLGIPKVLYDTKAEDSIEYGNTSAMVRFYSINGESGNRFPVSFGMGTFGGSSPIDVGTGRGGFAVSTFLDLVELTKVRNLGFLKKVIAGVELTQFFPIGRKARLLINAQVGFSP